MIDPWTCVAISGALWRDDATNFLLWQSADPSVILFTPSIPTLGIDPISKRYQFAVNILRDPATGKLSKGTASFLVNTGVTGDPAKLADLQQHWKARLGAGNPAYTGPADPQFRALNTQCGKATLVIDPVWGTWLAAANESDIGTPGGMASFDVDLTPEGAAEWYDCLTNGTPPSGSLVIDYQYLRLLPETEVNVKIDGKKVYNYFQAHLKAGMGGILYGSSAEIAAAWKTLSETGGVDVEWIGPKPGPDAGISVDDLTKTFLDQALKGMFSTLFAVVNDPKPFDSSKPPLLGWNAQFQFQWAHESDSLDLSMHISVKSATWMNESMDVTLAGLLAPALNTSYLTVVNEQTQVPIHYSVLPGASVVEADLLVQTYTDGSGVDSHDVHCGAAGAMIDYVVSTFDPASVRNDYVLQIGYDQQDAWPATRVALSNTGPAGTQVLIKSGQYTRNLLLMMLVVENGKTVLDPADTLRLEVRMTSAAQGVDVSYAPDTPLAAGAPLRCSWPVLPAGDPAGADGAAHGHAPAQATLAEASLATGVVDDVQVRISGFGTVQGQLVQLDWTDLEPGAALAAVVVRDGVPSVLHGSGLGRDVTLQVVPTTAATRSGATGPLAYLLG